MCSTCSSATESQGNVGQFHSAWEVLAGTNQMHLNLCHNVVLLCDDIRVIYPALLESDVLLELSTDLKMLHQYLDFVCILHAAVYDVSFSRISVNVAVTSIHV